MRFEPGPGVSQLIRALLDHLGGPERARAVEQLGPVDSEVDPRRLAAAMRAAHVDEAEARRIGVTAARAVDVALAARLAGVGSTERALRQADRLLPREQREGVFEIRALEQGEARVAYVAPTVVDPLLCAVRAGLLSGLPCSFGAEPARVEEVECTGRGADACCYRVRWSRSVADRPLLQTLALGALAGGVIGLAGWAIALWTPAGSLTMFAALGIAAASWLVESRRAARSDHQGAILSELEHRIAERMDDLAKLDANLERRDVAEGPAGGGRSTESEVPAGALQRELAAFGRELASLHARAGALPGNSELALQGDLEEIASRFEQLRSLADGLGGGTGPQAARREREDLSGLLAYVVQRARRADGNGPEIVLDVLADLPFVHCDAAQIERALAQLLRSACEAAGATGRVEVSAVAVAEGVEITVRDDGQGIDPDVVEEVFDPFFSEGMAAPGEGLRSAAAIVAEHGGALQLHADVKCGTRASFVLSLANSS